MDQYIVSVEVVFDAPRTIDQSPVAGYFRNFGITAMSLAQAEQLAIDESTEPGAIVTIESAREVDVRDLDEAIARHFTSQDNFGIWYRSGRGFYLADEDE
jgi:hypothetical protein